MMVHYTRPSGTMPLVEEAKAIARAASDVGIRIAFAIAVRDQNPVVYGNDEPVLSGLGADDRKTIEEMFVRAPMSPKSYIELTDAIAARLPAPRSTCNSVPPACSGAPSRCWKRSPKIRR